MGNKAIEILKKAEHDLDVEIRMWKNQGRPEVAQRCKLEKAQVRIAIRELCDSDTFEREQANELLPLVSVSESDIDDMFPYEDIETARPTRPENRIRAYNSRQADRREGAKRLLEKLHSR